MAESVGFELKYKRTAYGYQFPQLLPQPEILYDTLSTIHIAGQLQLKAQALMACRF